LVSWFKVLPIYKSHSRHHDVVHYDISISTVMHTGAYTWYNFTRARFNLQLPINYIKPPVNIKECLGYHWNKHSTVRFIYTFWSTYIIQNHILPIVLCNYLYLIPENHRTYIYLSIQETQTKTCENRDTNKPVKPGIQTNLWNQGYKQTCETRDTNKPVKPGIQTNTHIHQTQNNYIIFTCETRCTYAIKTKTSSTLTRSHVFTEVAKTFIKFNFILNVWLVIPCSYNKY
jgi:hypothetical protein